MTKKIEVDEEFFMKLAEHVTQHGKDITEIFKRLDNPASSAFPKTPILMQGKAVEANLIPIPAGLGGLTYVVDFPATASKEVQEKDATLFGQDLRQLLNKYGVVTFKGEFRKGTADSIIKP